MNDQLHHVRRKRFPLVEPDEPKPLVPGDVCPQCGRVVPAATPEKTPEPPKPEESNDADTDY